MSAVTGIWCVWFFFFQAEDGIRVLVRSRGLGDVYKRQVFGDNLRNLLLQPPLKGKVVLGLDPAYRTGCKLAVSYTHLTLPTIYSV